MQQLQRNWIRSIPNVLTILRLFLVPVFFYTYYHPNLLLPQRSLALAVFLLAGFTDVLDGYIARKFDAITDFGRLADPVADKLMTISALICLWESGHIKWFFVVLVLGKEAIMLIGSYVMLKSHVVVYSKWYGKAATFVMSLAIVLTFYPQTYPWNTYMLYLSLALTLYALSHYVRLAVMQLRELKEHPDNPRDIYSEED